MSIGSFPESLSQRILAGIILVGRLGVQLLWLCNNSNNHDNDNDNGLIVAVVIVVILIIILVVKNNNQSEEPRCRETRDALIA